MKSGKIAEFSHHCLLLRTTCGLEIVGTGEVIDGGERDEGGGEDEVLNQRVRDGREGEGQST